MQQSSCLWLHWTGLVMMAFFLQATTTAATGLNPLPRSSSTSEPPPQPPPGSVHEYNETLAYQFVNLCGTYVVACVPGLVRVDFICLLLCNAYSLQLMLHLFLRSLPCRLSTPPHTSPPIQGTSPLFQSCPTSHSHTTIFHFLPPKFRLCLLLHPGLRHVLRPTKPQRDRGPLPPARRTRFRRA